MSSIFIDANIFLELQLGQSRSAECKELLSLVYKGKIQAATTDFILDSVAVIMYDRKANPRTIKQFFVSLSLFKGLQLYDLNLGGRVLAAELMTRKKVDFDDATSLAAMVELKLKEVVSFDRHFDNFDVTRLEPREVLER